MSLLGVCCRAAEREMPAIMMLREFLDDLYPKDSVRSSMRPSRGYAHTRRDVLLDSWEPIA
jgi:hypothetical protein